MTSTDPLLLEKCLADVLPESFKFHVHHLSTPATECPAIFAAPPAQPPQETTCASHFLSISIDREDQKLQIFAIEVFIYFTAQLTTIFVSKADSTGYLPLLGLPAGTPSPLRTISTTFLEWLIRHRTKPDRKILLSLFARAQNQYLFPASIENHKKHVLDDRGLIKWWCKVLDPLLSLKRRHGETADETLSSSGQGFIRVPGCDFYSTRNFLPKSSNQQGGQGGWKVADPLTLIHDPSLPERCLVPRFPDDPKSRFLIDLDDELPTEEPSVSTDNIQSPPSSQISNPGRWRSVRSLDEFWELMSYRQECSAGRLVGFLWALFDPEVVVTANGDQVLHEEEQTSAAANLLTPSNSQHIEDTSTPPFPQSTSILPESLLQHAQHPMSVPLHDPPSDSSQAVETSLAATGPESSSKCLFLSKSDYEEVEAILLQLEYANEQVAKESTTVWIAKVVEKAGVQSWGTTIIGKAKSQAETAASGPSLNDAIPLLSNGLIRKKKRPATAEALEIRDAEVNNLSAGLIRKKAKMDIAQTEGKPNNRT